MLQMAFDAFGWVVRHVNRFDTEHWVIAFVVLLAIGFACMRGLGVRGKS